jgi:SAM-dependent methyltransferase
MEWLISHDANPEKMIALDFACGYGRFTRYFSRIFKEVVVSDLEEEMLQFARQRFGVDSFRSGIDSRSFDYPAQLFDIVFSYSLFTHLNPSIWKDWFEVLLNMVDEGGYLVITTRSPSFAMAKGDNLASFDRVLCTQKNETRGRLDTKIYGQTTVDKSYVQSIASSVGGNRYIDYFPGRSFDIYQDVHIFKKLGREVIG